VSQDDAVFGSGEVKNSFVAKSAEAHVLDAYDVEIRKSAANAFENTAPKVLVG